MGQVALCASRRISSTFAPPSLNLETLLASCACTQDEPYSLSSREQGLICNLLYTPGSRQEAPCIPLAPCIKIKSHRARVGGSGPQDVRVCGVQPGRLSGLLLGLPGSSSLRGDVSDHSFAGSFSWVVAQ